MIHSLSLIENLTLLLINLHCLDHVLTWNFADSFSGIFKVDKLNDVVVFGRDM